MIQQDSPDERIRFGPAVFTASAAVFLALAMGLASFPLVDVDEPRFATASRHMALGEYDWIVPRFNGEYRFDKPILIYWLQALCMRIFEPVLGFEFGARLPSAVAVAMSIPFLAGVGRMLGLRSRWAVLAALMAPTAGIVQLLGRACTADALLLGTTAFTAWVQVRLFRGHSSWRNWFLLGLGLIAVTLTKGPPAWIGPAALSVGLWRAGARPRVPRLSLTLLFALLGSLAWAIPAYVMTDGAFLSQGVGHHVIERASRPFEGHGGFGPQWILFYVYMIPVAFLPWSLFAFRGMHRDLRQRDGGFSEAEREGIRICQYWLGITALVFTVSVSKLPHYPVPAFPAAAIWMTLGLQRARDTGLDTARADRVVAWCLRALGLVFAVLLVALFPIAGLDLQAQVVINSLVFLGGFGLAAHRWSTGHARGALLATAMTSLLGLGLFGSATMPRLQHAMIEREFREDLSWLPKDQAIHQFSLSIPSLVFYSERTIEKLQTEEGGPSQALQALRHIVEPGHLVITRRSKLIHLRDTVRQMPEEVQERLLQVLTDPPTMAEGFLPSKGKVVELVLLGL